jgi:cytochrome b
LPTRLFHWALVVAVVGLIVTGNAGGSWMTWHMRLGYTVFALVLFRLFWGFWGGHWSRFAQFVPTPARLLAYLQQGSPSHSVGHNPLGALSVVALLAALLAQVGTGLFSDDEIAFTGPLSTLVSPETVSLASWYHADVGKLLLLGLVALHVLAIAYHKLFKKENLITPMLTGDQAVPMPAPPASHDSLKPRLLALVVLGVSACVVYGVIALGNA